VAVASPAASATAPPAAGAAQRQRILLTGTVAGQAIRALFDPGAEAECIMLRRTFDLLGLRAGEDTGLKCRGIGGTVNCGLITQPLPLKMGRYREKLKFVVLDDPAGALDYDIILGYAWCARLDVAPHWHDKTLTLTYKGEDQLAVAGEGGHVRRLDDDAAAVAVLVVSRRGGRLLLLLLQRCGVLRRLLSVHGAHQLAEGVGDRADLLLLRHIGLLQEVEACGLLGRSSGGLPLPSGIGIHTAGWAVGFTG
jgi:hypothetical protein